MKKEAIYSILGLFLLLSIVNGSALLLQVSPINSSGSLTPNTPYNYTINLTTDSLCNNVILSNSTNITTNEAGIGFIFLNTSTLNSSNITYYICEYRNGLFRASIKHSDILGDNGYFSGNVSASYFHGRINYSDIDNIPSISGDNQSWNQSGADARYTNFSSFNSTQIVNSGGFINIIPSWIISLIDLSSYARIVDLVSYVGNWSADKPNYWNSTQILNGTLALNSSLSNYYPNGNPNGYINSTNYTNVFFTNSTDNNITVNNLTVTNTAVINNLTVTNINITNNFTLNGIYYYQTSGACNLTLNHSDCFNGSRVIVG